jgi:oxygen-dependent protoporphyrinogen oxidase
MTMNVEMVIIGAGISGLVAAHRLKKMGRDPLIIESGDRVGGVIQSLDAEGFLIERGPNSLRGSNEFLDLVEELNLTDELVRADPRAPAYIYADRRLQAAPMGPPALVKTKLISTTAKLRLLREPFVKARREGGEESVASFVRRRLGNEVLERMVAPFLSGVYAGDPEELSVQACFPKLAEFEAEAGSLLRGALRSAQRSRKRARKGARNGTNAPKRSLRPYRLCSFRHGLSALPESLSGSLGDRLLTGARIIGIRSAGGFEIKVEHRGDVKTIKSPALVVSTSAYVAARLLSEIAPEISALVDEIPYVSIASVSLAYRVEQVTRKLDGFGFLAPRGEGLRTLGSIWNSSLFAGRAPEGWVCLTNFIGGATDPEAIKMSDEELIRIVHDDLSKVLGISGAPRRLPITRYERAIPQYTLGHAARVERIESALREIPGLWIAGNYLRGLSLGDCIKQAERVASEVNQAWFNEGFK